MVISPLFYSKRLKVSIQILLVTNIIHCIINVVRVLFYKNSFYIWENVFVKSHRWIPIQKYRNFLWYVNCRKTRFYIESLCDTIKWVEHLFISPKVPLKMPALLYFLRDAKGQKREIHYHLSTCIHLVVVYVDLHKHLCLIMCPLIVVLLLTHQNRKQIWNHFRKGSKQDNRL